MQLKIIVKNKKTITCLPKKIKISIHANEKNEKLISCNFSKKISR